MADKNLEKKGTNITTILLGVVIGLAILYLIFNWGSIFRLFAPPNPTVVSKGVENASTQFLEFDAGVWAEIRNDGGNGTIAMKVTFSQNGNTITKTTTRYYKSLETARMEIVFNESKLLGDKPSYSLEVFPFGK